MCDACNIPVGDLKSISSGVTGIPLAGVMNDEFAPLLVWAFCINAQKVKDAFKAIIKEDIDESKLNQLIKVHNDGNDVREYKINFLHFLNGIHFTTDEINQASCTYKLTK